MSDRTITTTVMGEASAPPDEAGVQVTASASAPDPSAAREAVAEQVASLNEVLKEVDVPEDRIRTERFRIERERSDRKPGGPPDGGARSDRDPPYRAIQHIGITVRELDRLDGILSAAVDRAGVGVDRIDFGFRTDTRRELQQEAVADAVNAARRKAATAAREAGSRLGDAVSIVTDDASNPSRSLEMASGDASSQSVASGPIDTQVRVEVTYEMDHS